MCDFQVNIISKNSLGQFSFCTQCKLYNLSFNNVLFEFDKKELFSFQRYINSIDTEYWESAFHTTKVKRKIPIPTVQGNLILVFSKKELGLLKELVSYPAPQFKSKSFLIESVMQNFSLN